MGCPTCGNKRPPIRQNPVQSPVVTRPNPNKPISIRGVIKPVTPQKPNPNSGS